MSNFDMFRWLITERESAKEAVTLAELRGDRWALGYFQSRIDTVDELTRKLGYSLREGLPSPRQEGS